MEKVGIHIIMSHSRVLSLAIILILIVDFGQCRAVQKRLQALNKPSVKTILTKEGDVLDCVRFYDQPAFDHPALKNHKIQLASSTKNGTESISGTRREACPEGSVPIRRTTERDLLAADSFPEPQAAFAPSKDFRLLCAREEFSWARVQGTYADIGLYNLNITDEQTSMAAMWVTGRPDEANNKDFIAVGWIVSHYINGDSKTRLFGVWHNSRTREGCYNTKCPGFVQVHREIPINHAFEPQPYSQFTLQLDDDDNWWVKLGEDKKDIGYWPRELFSDLYRGARTASWGGETFPGSNGQFPPMGSGTKPNGEDKTVGYISNIHIHQAGEYPEDVIPRAVEVFKKGSDCYDLQLTESRWQPALKPLSLTFGGPGGTCNDGN